MTHHFFSEFTNQHWYFGSTVAQKVMLHYNNYYTAKLMKSFVTMQTLLPTEYQCTHTI